MHQVQKTTLCCLIGLWLSLSGCSQPDPVIHGRRVSQWVAQLGEKDPAACETAVEALLLGGDDAVPRVVTALNNPDWETRCGAACVLLKSGSQWQSFVHSLLTAAEGETQLSLAQAIFRTGSEGTAAVQVVLANLKHKDPMIRHLATHVLGDLSPMCESAVPALAEALTSADSEIRHRAMLGLVRIGPGALAALSAVTVALHDTDVRVRLGAVQALGAMGDGARPAADKVAQVLDDPSDEVRHRAREILRSWEVLPPL